MRAGGELRLVLERLRITARRLQTEMYRGSMLRTNSPRASGHAEVFLEYHALISGDDGRAYRARACGGEAPDGTHRWQGWIEFWPRGEGLPVRTARETTQPDRRCAVYWSTGLTPVYLEGALERALWLSALRQG